MEKKQLWQTDAIYQIYPRSFCDSNGDGIGDIPGIISKLDYLADLGIKMIWLSPVYASPQFDLGYDISDYYKINPEYGTMEDFDRLLAEAKKRGIRIIMDLVANHTSDQHWWFKQSIDPKSPYHDYYIWRKGKNGDGITPPNNWTSNFSGSAWTYEPSTNEWYLHLFAKEQPDLNWHNEKVVQEIENIIRFYMDKGVYGFRCDVIDQIWKDSLEDGKGNAVIGLGSEHYIGVDGNHKMLRRLYDDVYSKYEDHVVIGETSGVSCECGKKYLENHELDMFFEFEHINVDRCGFSGAFHKKFKAQAFKEIFYRWQKGVPWLAVYLENHDQMRSIPRYGNSKKYWKESGKALALFYLCCKGTPFVYQGQEIGMLAYPSNRDPKKSKDVCIEMLIRVMKKLHMPSFIGKGILNRFDRDNARSPMQWNDSTSAGFSTSENTWLPVFESYKEINVKKEENDPDSILNFYKKLLHIRSNNEVLHDGAFEELPTKGDLIAYYRVKNARTCLVLLNFGTKKLNLPKPYRNFVGKVLISTYPDASLSNLASLRPYEGLLIELD